jgi:hypothetical protein
MRAISDAILAEHGFGDVEVDALAEMNVIARERRR